MFNIRYNFIDYTKLTMYLFRSPMETMRSTFHFNHFLSINYKGLSDFPHLNIYRAPYLLELQGSITKITVDELINFE